MPHKSLNKRYLSASLMALALLSACGERVEGSDTDTANAADQTASTADGDKDRTATPGLPALIPPAPGEPGGLPDDRRPLDESPIDPASIRGAGSIVEKYAIALERKDFDSAYAMWREDDKSKRADKSAFTEAYDKYLTIHAQIGRPEAAGDDTARVPVQLYGRLKNSNNEPFNLIGPVTLARTGNKQKPWIIIDSALEPRGVVREDKSGTTENSVDEIKAIIPSEFHGKWAASADLCNSDSSALALQIKPEKLEFWESLAKVTSAEQDGQRLTVTADYTGEGETWTRTTSYTLSLDGQTLTSDDGTKRVKCR